MSVPETIVSEQSIAVPIAHPGVAVGRRSCRGRARTGCSRRCCFSSRWSPIGPRHSTILDCATITRICARRTKNPARSSNSARRMRGRFMAGCCKRLTVRPARCKILQWMRFGASLLLGAIALVSFRGLRALGWSFSTSLCFAVLLALIPSAQVIAAWAVGWPYAATALLAFGGFFTVEGALSVGMSAGRGRAVGQWAVALGLMVVSALIYQPSAMFYVVPLAGALIVQRHRTLKQTARWVGIHLGFVVGTLGLAYCVMSVPVRGGGFRQIRPRRVRASLGREDRLVPAGTAAECAQPVRVERQQSSRPRAVSRLRRPRRRAAAGGRLSWSGAVTGVRAASFG